jgi:hypothetical protein
MSDTTESSEHPSAHHQRLGQQDGFSRFAAIIVPAFIAVLVAMAGQGVLAWRDIAVLNHSVEELANTYITDAATLAAIAQQAHANSIHREEHERSAERWIDKILENERAIHSLQTDAAARKDPFTGTEGAELRRRIEALEGRTR